MYVAWDTETTGLPLIRTRPTLKNIHKYDTCRIVSLAAVKFSSRGREVASFHRIIKPEGYTVGATEVHGITHDYAMEHGSPFREVFKEFIEFVGSVETLVAHNSRFDENVLMSETLRLGLTIPSSFEYVCTHEMHKEKMFSSVKLIDLYTTIFGEGFDGAHDALNDARACGKVYPHLKEHAYRHTHVGIPRVTIKASDVSSIMGLSQFKKPQDVVEELWLKHSPETFTMKTKEERALAVLASCPEVHGIDDVEDAPLTPSEKGLVKDYYRKQQPRPMNSSPGSFYRYNVCCIDGTLYQIVGKVDTIRQNEDGSRTLIEMKKRTSGLFNRLRDYEEVLCRVYLSMMHPSVRNVLLVESYEGEMKSYLVERDEVKWEKIRRRLQSFCSYFHERISYKE